MMFNLLCLLLIVLITLYMATQGMLTALLALVTASFSSLLAMGLMEPVENLLAGWKPDYARGLAVLLVFAVVFAITRIVADMIVPKNVKLPLLAGRIAGGIVGFFVALVVVGTCIIGIELMPLPTELLGYDRFPSETRMQGDVPGVPAHMANTWLAPERFTLALWNGASGRALGGARAFADVHPDLSVEAYGYRNTINLASRHVLPEKLLKIEAAWTTADPKDYQPLGIKTVEPGRKLVMVRAAVSKGGGGDKDVSSADSDDLFRVTPTEVRLVTDKGRQYYPIGCLTQGYAFEALPLDSGQVVDDYVKQTAREDWVFEINDDESPRLVEVKAARAELAGIVQDKPVPPMAVSDYPQKQYRKERSSLTVTLNTKGDKLVDGKVYILRTSSTAKDMYPMLNTAHSHVKEVLDAMENNSSVWVKRPGVPDKGVFSNAARIAVDTMNAQPTDPITWSRALPLLMLTPVRADGPQNIAALSQFVDDTLVPYLEKIKTGSIIITSAAADASGKVKLPNIPKGSFLIFATAKTEHGFYYWALEQQFEAHSDKAVTLTPEQAAQPKIEVP